MTKFGTDCVSEALRGDSGTVVLWALGLVLILRGCCKIAVQLLVMDRSKT